MGKLFPEHHIDNVLRYQAFVQFSVRLFPAVFCNASAFVFIVQKVGDLVDEIIVGTEKNREGVYEDLLPVSLNTIDAGANGIWDFSEPCPPKCDPNSALN